MLRFKFLHDMTNSQNFVRKTFHNSHYAQIKASELSGE